MGDQAGDVIPESSQNGHANPVFDNDKTQEEDASIGSKPSSTTTDNHNSPATVINSGVTDERCGCFKCYPDSLQRFAKPISYLICICFLVFTQSMVVSGYSSGILTTIEKRYELSSSQLGLVISSYDIAALLAGIIVSYYGDQRNRAAWLGRGSLIISLGSFLFSIPHFIGGTYVIKSNSTLTGKSLCNTSDVIETEDCETLAADKWAFGIFMGAFALIGFGASPIYSLGPTYLYDNVAPSRYPLYAGIMYSMGALGPACGFLVAAVFLQLYVHPDKSPEEYEDGDTEWVGAWWIGFLLCTVLAFMIALPFQLFPKQLPLDDRIKDDQDKPDFANFGAQLKEFPKYMLKMVRNVTWLGISLVMVVEQSIGAGFNRFIAKYIELAHRLPSHRANIITGLVLIPAAVIGIISGGVIMKKLKLGIIGIVRFLLFLNFIPTIALAILFTMGCSSIDLVGVTDQYGNMKDEATLESIEITYDGNLTSYCNINCECIKEEYEPVCGSDHRTYYNPCYAGCADINKKSNKSVKEYTSCSCINGTSLAEEGKCETGCEHLAVFLIILFIIVLTTTMGQNPALLITLWSVDAGSRSLSLGMQNFLIQLIAFIPAPIYFGKVFDSQCLLWSSTCGDDGACLEYNTETLPYVLFGTCIAFKGLTFLFLALTYVSSKCQGFKTDVYVVENTQIDTKSSSLPSTGMESTDTAVTNLSFNTDK